MTKVCDHTIGRMDEIDGGGRVVASEVSDTYNPYENIATEFTYGMHLFAFCPDCGEKLDHEEGIKNASRKTHQV